MSQQPCDIGDADGVAMAFLEKGTKVTPLPFRQPALGDKQIRIRVTHAGLCMSDLLTSTGQWGEPYLPLVPGHEIVGIVEKVGEKVSHLHEGDKVGFGVYRDCCDACSECRTGHENMCAAKSYTYDPYSYGGYATSFQSRGDFFFKLDESFPGYAAPLFCAGTTIYNPLKQYAKPFMKVGIIGIGGLGHVAIKFANKFGCEVTAISTSPGKEQEAKSMGAHHFINSKDPESLKKHANSLDLILDTCTAVNLEQDFALVRPRGHVALVGAPNVEHDCNLNITQILMRQQELHGSEVGPRMVIEDMLEFVRLHNIVPDVDIYPFADTQSAVNSLFSGSPKWPRYRNVIETKDFFNTFTPRSN